MLCNLRKSFVKRAEAEGGLGQTVAEIVGILCQEQHYGDAHHQGRWQRVERQQKRVHKVDRLDYSGQGEQTRCGT